MSVPPGFSVLTAFLKHGKLSKALGTLGVALLLVPVVAISALGITRGAPDASRLQASEGSQAPMPNSQGAPLALAQAATQAAKTPTAPSHAAIATSKPATSTSTSNGCTITSTDASGVQSLLVLLNQHRAAAGVAPLKLNATLSMASQQHSCDMFRHQLISHTGSDGSSPLQRIQSTGVSLTTWGENIGTASGLGLAGDINQIDSAMMAEPLTAYDHHWNIVHAAFTQAGLGIIYVNGQVWLTEDFVG